MGVLFAVYAVVNGIAWWLASPQEFGDTYRYFGSALLDIQNPGITPVFLYTTVGSPEALTAIQVGLQTLAFIWLAVEVRRSIPSRVLGNVVAVLLLVGSLLPTVWSWTQLLGSESLTIAAAVAWGAAVLHFLRTSAWGSVAVLSITTALLLVTRPMLAGVVLAATLLIVLARWRAGRAQVMVIGGAALAFSIYAVARLQLLSSDPTFRVRYAIGNFIDKGPSFRGYAVERMPACEPLVAAVNGPAPWDDGWKFQGTLGETCPETFLWMRSSATSTTSWVPAAPQEAWANFVGIVRDLGYVGYTPWSGIPGVGTVPGMDLPVWQLSLAALLMGLVLTLAIGRLRWSWTAALSSLVLLAAVVTTAFVVWSADGIEHSRHMQPLTSLLPFAALALIPLGFSSARQRGAAADSSIESVTAGSARAD